jgi:peptidoglycan/LPS O-acetylase OafA/YrhL
MQPALYWPRLDTLRTFAVAGVIYAHTWDIDSKLGDLGVRLFFVLSGFLITGIVLGLRSDMGGVLTRRQALVAFYARRALRIWPAYFLLLFALLAVNFQEIREVAPWHLLFLSNYLFALEGAWVPPITAHYWTLAVEEQFYVLWPLLILFVPRRALWTLPVAAVAIGFIYVFTLGMFAVNGFGPYILPPGVMNDLGAGALMAWWHRKHESLPGWLIPGGAIAAAVALFLDPASWLFTWITTLSLAAIVAFALGSSKGIAGRVLDLSLLRWMGKISYGIYLYHLVCRGLLRLAIPYFPILGADGPMRFLVTSALSVIVAAISWYSFELPLNRLKRRFPYDRLSHRFPSRSEA